MLALLVLACSPPETPDRTADPSTETSSGGADTAAPTTTPTPTPTTPGTTPTTPTETLDCSALPATGTLFATLDYAPTFEDFTFSDDGYAWGISASDGALTRIPYGGPAEVLRPNVSTYARGTRFLPDGDLVAVDYPNNAVIRIDRTTYAVTILNQGLTIPNGIAIGDDGFIYLTQGTGDVRRIDPVTGAAPILVHSPVSNDGISFSPDYRTLYLDSDSTTDFLSLGVDAAGAVSSPIVPVATLPSVSDGMVVDACGNAYVTQWTPPAIVRVHPDGTVDRFIELPQNSSFVSANFGTGVGGWTATHLFLAGFGAGMAEYDAGVPGKWEPHLPP